mmetsp:Transcript_128727/g.372489  ORF Transcript_128727/g.372489 Transcript_128727/m.372489 type:complete len:216 (-) Transcript_128727:1140-1787(-)
MVGNMFWLHCGQQAFDLHDVVEGRKAQHCHDPLCGADFLRAAASLSNQVLEHLPRHGGQEARASLRRRHLRERHARLNDLRFEVGLLRQQVPILVIPIAPPDFAINGETEQPIDREQCPDGTLVFALVRLSTRRAHRGVAQEEKTQLRKRHNAIVEEVPQRVARTPNVGRHLSYAVPVGDPAMHGPHQLGVGSLGNTSASVTVGTALLSLLLLWR